MNKKKLILKQINSSPYLAVQVTKGTEGDKRLELIQSGVERIKETGRINTLDFEDIIEKLKDYGMGFVDAQNVIIATYLEQME